MCTHSFKGHTENNNTYSSPNKVVPAKTAPDFKNDANAYHLQDNYPIYKGDNYSMTPRWLEKHIV